MRSVRHIRNIFLSEELDTDIFDILLSNAKSQHIDKKEYELELRDIKLNPHNKEMLINNEIQNDIVDLLKVKKNRNIIHFLRGKDHMEILQNYRELIYDDQVINLNKQSFYFHLITRRNEELSNSNYNSVYILGNGF